MKIRIPIHRRTLQTLRVLAIVALILIGCFLAAVWRMNTGV